MLDSSKYVKIFPPSESERLHTEVLSLKRLQGLPLIPTCIGSYFKPNQYGWILQNRLRGEPINLNLHKLNNAETKDLVCQAADWLEKLHKVQITDSDRIFRHSSQQQRWTWISKHFSRIPEQDHEIAHAALSIIVDQAESGNLRERIGFVHRDFGFRNMLFRRSNSGRTLLSGVLDFEHCYIGNPISDLAMFIIQDLLDLPDLLYLLIQRYIGNTDINHVSTFFRNEVAPELLINAMVAMTWSSKRAPEYYQSAKLVLSKATIFGLDSLLWSKLAAERSLDEYPHS